MKKPLLQIALDNTSLEDAFRTLSGGLDEAVDIIEVGTMLLLTEGLRAAQIMRVIYPHKLLVADFKSVAPHFGSQCLKRDPDFTTVLSCAEHHVKCAIAEEAAARGKGQQVQVELYGDGWTLEDVKLWKDCGISHVIFSRPRSRKGPWSAQDADDIRRLTDLGMEVTATGGITCEDLDVLAGLPIFAVICGRSVRNAPDPAAEALRVKARIEELWA